MKWLKQHLSEKSYAALVRGWRTSLQMTMLDLSRRWGLMILDDPTFTGFFTVLWHQADSIGGVILGGFLIGLGFNLKWQVSPETSGK